MYTGVAPGLANPICCAVNPASQRLPTLKTLGSRSVEPVPVRTGAKTPRATKKVGTRIVTPANVWINFLRYTFATDRVGRQRRDCLDSRCEVGA